MKVKAHQRYKLKDGTIVPGATTILSVLNKPALVKWANNLGLQGIDSNKYRDEKAEIGTLAHYFVECELKGEEPDTSDYTKNQIDQAENALIKFYEWRKNNDLQVIGSELQLVSEKYKYGGTVDCYGILNSVPTLIDFKTSKAIYPEMLHQLAAYKQLLEENGYPVKKARILRIGRDETEGFEELLAGNLKLHWRIFKHCREIYELQKILKKEAV
jgi:hypothetical protein